MRQESSRIAQFAHPFLCLESSMTSRPLPLILVAATLGILSGCAGNALSPEDIRPLHHSSGPLALERVNGIRQALESSTDAPVRLLAVHGMITNKAGYSDTLQKRLAERLGMQVGIVSEQTPLARGYDFVPSYGAQPFDGVTRLVESSLKRTAWTTSGPDGRPVERLVVYELLWSPLRDQIKDDFGGCFERGETGGSSRCKSFSTARPNPDPRFIINRALKETITLGGFADATLVLGPIGDVVRDDMTLALCVVASDFLAPGGNALQDARSTRCDLARSARAAGGFDEAMQTLQRRKFLAVTHSLGSFFLMDAQHAFTAAEAQTQGNVCARAGPACDEQQQGRMLFQMTDPATVFMNANQVSLLSLARLSSSGCRPVRGKECPNPFLRSRSGGMEPWNQIQGFPRMTVFVALNDTNDLLGFELPPYLGDIDGNRFVNVSVRNPAFTIPGLFKNPGGAHTNQADNPAVIEAIVEGFALPR